MEKLTVDGPLLTRLDGLTTGKELCDPDGRTLGIVLPLHVYDHLMDSLFEGIEAEAERSWQDYLQHGGGKTTPEVLAYLATLDRDLPRGPDG
jgi:hypothetical protein